jgi:hypothetical protein
MGGRVGPVTVVFGLFIVGIKFALKLLYYALAGAVGVLLLLGLGIRELWRWHKRRKALRDGESPDTVEEPEEQPPTVVIAPVTNRKDDDE